jgi:hypothetical protein
MFELITTYYKAADPEREAENLQCLVNNLNHPLIERVHLFLQSSNRPNLSRHDKLNFVFHDKRPTFSELFAYGNSLNVDIIKVVANSDIFFDDSIKLAVQALQKWDVLALTRWDYSENGSHDFYNNFKSQDVWIFKNFIDESIGNYHIGRHGCDIRLAYEFKNRKYKIINPSLSIKTIHIHSSGLRPYFEDPNYEYVSPPYLYLLPTYLNNFRELDEDKIKKFRKARYRFYRDIYLNQYTDSRKNTFFGRFIALLRCKYYAYFINKNFE